MSVRTGPQFSFDVGGSTGSDDAVRILFSYRLSSGCEGDVCWADRDPNGTTPLHLEIATCNALLVHCSIPIGGNSTGWAYPSATSPNELDQFHPNIVYGGGQWKITFHSRENFVTGDEVALMAATLNKSATGTKSLTVSQRTATQRPCPSGHNYWGDYDGMAYIGRDESNVDRFIRLITDSTGASCTSGAWAATPVHVTSVRF